MQISQPAGAVADFPGGGGGHPLLPGDLRERHKVISLATQHHILQLLRSAYNWAVKRRMIDFNPCLAVELPPVVRDPARVWSPEQVRHFLASAFASASDEPLSLLYRIVLLRGLRRGEACGLRWCDFDAEPGRLRIMQTVLQLGDRIVIDTPKSQAGKRTVSLYEETTRMLVARRAEQRRQKFAAGAAHEDHDLIHAQPDGLSVSPERVSIGFKRMAEAAGLPVIKLHEARHTAAATLGLEAGLDVKVVSVQLGHANTRVTHDMYMKVRPEVLDQAAARVLPLVQGDPAAEKQEA